MARTRKRTLAKKRKAKTSAEKQDRTTASGVMSPVASARVDAVVLAAAKRLAAPQHIDGRSEGGSTKAFNVWCREATIEIRQTRNVWQRQIKTLSGHHRAAAALLRAT